MKKKILIVDDEEDLARLVKADLDLEGFDCSLAVDGLIALEKLKEDLPDLILLDIAMPRLNGFGVLQQVKEDPRTKDIPVVMCTTFSRAQDREKAYKLGASDYLTKPFEITVLIKRIRKILGEI